MLEICRGTAFDMNEILATVLGDDSNVDIKNFYNEVSDCDMRPCIYLVFKASYSIREVFILEVNN